MQRLLLLLPLLLIIVGTWAIVRQHRRRPQDSTPENSGERLLVTLLVIGAVVAISTFWIVLTGANVGP